MTGEEAENKSYDATPEKLRSLREKGEVPSQRELSQSFIFVLTVLIFAISIQYLSRGYLSVLSELQISWLQLDGSRSRLESVTSRIDEVAYQTFLVFASVFIFALLVAAWMNPSRPQIKRVKPDINRMNVIENFGQKFSGESLSTFCRNAIVMFACFTLLISSYVVIIFHIDVLQFYDLTSAIIHLTFPTLALLVGYVGILILGAIFDNIHKRISYFAKHRMTRQELVDEQKATEGDPHFKAERRNLAVQLLKDDSRNVQNADVVMVNPTHLAIALKWDGAKGSAPICVCKGRGERARRLKKLAADFAIPIYRDVGAVRSMYLLIEVGGEVPTSHYKPVAAAVTFARRVAGIRSAAGGANKSSS